jgi:large subunit ribosomal protein L29
MKVKETLKDYRAKDAAQLREVLTGIEKEILNLRFRKAVNQIPDSSLIPKLKKNVARIETVLKEKKLAETV